MTVFHGEREIAPGIYLTEAKDLQNDPEIQAHLAKQQGAEEGEVEVVPGIYMTKAKSQRKDPVTLSGEQMQKRTMEFLESDPKAHYEWLQLQVSRIELGLEKLVYSNAEMIKADPNDPDFMVAVDENIVIMKRNEVYLEDYRKQANELAKKLGICLMEDIKLGSSAAEDDGEGGVFL